MSVYFSSSSSFLSPCKEALFSTTLYKLDGSLSSSLPELSKTGHPTDMGFNLSKFKVVKNEASCVDRKQETPIEVAEIVRAFQENDLDYLEARLEEARASSELKDSPAGYKVENGFYFFDEYVEDSFEECCMLCPETTFIKKPVAKSVRFRGDESIAIERPFTPLFTSTPQEVMSFVFGEKQEHCESFAARAVNASMARSQGVMDKVKDVQHWKKFARLTWCDSEEEEEMDVNDLSHLGCVDDCESYSAALCEDSSVWETMPNGPSETFTVKASGDAADNTIDKTHYFDGFLQRPRIGSNRA